MTSLTPAQIAQKWATNLGNSVNTISAGVKAVQVSPGQAASNASARWQQAVSSAKALAEYQKNTAKVTLAGWQQAMLNIGIPRISQGANARVNDQTTFYNALMPFIAAGLPQIKNMPSTTLQDRINRMTAWVNYMAGFTAP